MVDVLNADIKSLLKDPSIDLLVNLNTNSMGGNVVDDTSASVVPLVRHTGLDGRVGLNVYVVSLLEQSKVVGKI